MKNILAGVFSISLLLLLSGCSDVNYVRPNKSIKDTSQTLDQTPAPIEAPAPSPAPVVTPTQPQPAPAPTPAPVPAPVPTPTPVPTPAPTPAPVDIVVTNSTDSFVDARGATWKLGIVKHIMRNGQNVASVGAPNSLWQTNTLLFRQSDQKVYIWGHDGLWYFYDDSISYLVQATQAPMSTNPDVFLLPLTTIGASSGESLVTAIGTWTFGNAVQGLNDFEVLIDGQSASQGSGVEIHALRDDIYVLNSVNEWWRWIGSTWEQASDPH